MHRRPALAADAAFLEALDRDTLGPYGKQAFGWGDAEVRRQFLAEFDPATREILVVDGQDVGCLGLEDHGDWWFIDYIAILPAFQNRGIGTQVVREVLARAAAVGVRVRLNVLQVNPAHALYRRLGFRVVGGDAQRYFMEWTEEAFMNREEVARKTVVYRMPGMERAQVRRNLEIAEGIAMDLYRPADAAPDTRVPVVLFVCGFPEPTFARGLKETGGYVSWAQLMAASGIAAVTYAYREPVADVATLLAYLRRNAGELGIDSERMGIWAASGNVPVALSLLMSEPPDAFRCAALCYGLMLDLGGATSVAQAAAHFGFTNASAGKQVSDLPRELPLLVARAGKDAPGINQAIDRFTAEALALNLPVTVANHASGPHAFDIFEDSEISREMVRRTLEFVRFHLAA